MSKDGELTLFDIADWLWSFRFLALALLLAAAVWVGIAAYMAPRAATSQQYDVHVRIFPSGSPLRHVPDISNVIIASVEKAETAALTSEPDDNPLIFRAKGTKQADAAVLAIMDLGVELTNEVRGRVAILEPIVATNESAVVPYLMAKDFLHATDSGMFQLISAESVLVSSNGAPTSILRAVAFPVIVCGIAFFILALGMSFVRAWRQRKNQTA